MRERERGNWRKREGGREGCKRVSVEKYLVNDCQAVSLSPYVRNIVSPFAGNLETKDGRDGALLLAGRPRPVALIGPRDRTHPAMAALLGYARATTFGTNSAAHPCYALSSLLLYPFPLTRATPALQPVSEPHHCIPIISEYNQYGQRT